MKNKKIYGVVCIVIIAILAWFVWTQYNISSPKETNINLIAINEAVENFSNLKKGTLQAESSQSLKENTVKALGYKSAKNDSVTAFVLNDKGYLYIEEITTILDDGEPQYTAYKQSAGKRYFGKYCGDDNTDDTTKEYTKYEWQVLDEQNDTSYEANGVLKLMMGPSILLNNPNYIDTITRVKDGSLMKYTITPNEQFKTFVKEEYHSQDEDYNILEKQEIYWIDESGMLIKRQSYDVVDWKMDGIKDIYTFNWKTRLIV